METMNKTNMIGQKNKFDQSFSTIESNNSQTINYDSNFSSVSLKEPKNEIYYIDEKAEKTLVKKLDLHILPLFCMFYFADFLDRANIGNAT